MARTAEGWLDYLAQQMDARRQRLNLLRAYMDGNAPLPDGAEDCREAYANFQRKARTNFAELVVDSVAERMRVSGFQVGDALGDDDTARRIWEYNRMDVGAADVHRDMLGLGTSYAMVQPPADDSGIPVITGERPEQVITESDPLRHDVVRAALKVWRDEAEGMDFAFLHLPGRLHMFHREAVTPTPVSSQRRPDPILTAQGGWISDTDEAGISTGLPVVPIVPFVNRDHRGEFETHTDLLDRINWVMLQRLVITAMQAFRQRATKGDLPETDEAGNPVNYAELFKPGPGALWQLPEGVELWESAQTSLQDVLESVKADVTHLAAVTRTPISMLIPEGQNQSAEGASFAKEGLVFKAGDRNHRVDPSWERVMRIAFALSDGTDDPPEVDVQWMPTERQSLAERYDALTKAGADVPWRTKMTSILQFSGAEVDRMATERAEDIALTAAFAPVAQPTEEQGDGDSAA